MTVSLLTGDCRELLRAMPTASVQCAITSPPYWGLRDYKGEPQIWGGDADHMHIFGDAVYLDKRGSGADNDATGRQRGEVYGRNAARGAFCSCGAWLGQLGLETTPQAYITHLVEVFAEVRRILRPNGTLWLVLGDSYVSAKGASHGFDPKQKVVRRFGLRPNDVRIPGLKGKDLVGIPWRAAFGLQDAGWWLRSDVIWAKNNPMPGSQKDRPTTSHEYVFLLAKQKTYYYDWKALQERSVAGGLRNRRTVWPINTQPYKGAHFAVYPEALVEPCLLAGSKPGDTVLDPFGGAGTTALVADRLGRNAISIDINEEYSTLSAERIYGKQESADERSA